MGVIHALPFTSATVSWSSSSQGRCGKPKAPTSFEQSSTDQRGLPHAGAQRRFIAQIEYRLIGRNERGAAGQQALDLPAHLPRPAQQQDDRQLAQVAPVRLFPDAVRGGES